jgi:hypothetical protein
VRTTLFSILAIALLSACVTHQIDRDADRDLINAALTERNLAQARLIKAIGSYCSARHDLVDARYRCILDKTVEALGADKTVFAPGSASTLNAQSRFGRLSFWESVDPIVW